MPDDRRKSVPRDVRRREALAKQKEKDAKARARAKKATVKLLTAHLDKDQAKAFRALSEEPDLSLLYRLALVDLATLGESYSKGLLPPDQYATKRLRYLDLLRRLAATLGDLVAEPVSDLHIHLPPLESGEAWFMDPESGEVVDPEELNPEPEPIEDGKGETDPEPA